MARWAITPRRPQDGNSIWLAAEYIPGSIDRLVYSTDWGTFVYDVGEDF